MFWILNRQITVLSLFIEGLASKTSKLLCLPLVTMAFAPNQQNYCFCEYVPTFFVPKPTKLKCLQLFTRVLDPEPLQVLLLKIFNRVLDPKP